MLEDGRQRDQRLALQMGQQHLAVALGVLGAAGQHFADRLTVRCALVQHDVEPFLPVIAFFHRGVVAGKLELVLPAQLQVHGVQGLAARRLGLRGQGQQQAGQASQQPAGR